MPRAVKLTAKGLAWLNSGRLWIYRDDVAGSIEGLAGETVPVESPAGAFLGHAFVSGKSKIALRLISPDPAPPDRAFFAALIHAAKTRRGGSFGPDTACRLINAEGDLFPGLIVDHYAGHLVIQSMVQAVDRLLPTLVEILEEELAPAAIVIRNDGSVRRLEGLPAEKRMVRGEEPSRVEVREGQVRYLADLWSGQKTGAYLDQQANRLDHAAFRPGTGLDLFAYHGHFALQMAARCDRVLAIESSPGAIERINENLKLNGLDRVTAMRANVFEELAALEDRGERFDCIVVDPPPFAKSKKDVAQALKGYKQLNLRAMRLLGEGGRLLTYSCSFNVSAGDFLEVLRAAAADARRRFRIVTTHAQAPDHPILLSVPETAYLKGYVLEAI